MIDKPRFSTVEVCNLTGITYRQADYLARWVGFTAAGSGTHRRWTPRQVAQAFVITTLMSNGRPGREASSVAELVKPTTEFIVVPPDPVEAYAATDLLDVLDGVQAPATVVVRLPVKLRRLLGQAVVEPAPAPHL